MAEAMRLLAADALAVRAAPRRGASPRPTARREPARHAPGRPSTRRSPPRTSVTYAVQVNGKLRGQVQVRAGRRRGRGPGRRARGDEKVQRRTSPARRCARSSSSPSGSSTSWSAEARPPHAHASRGPRPLRRVPPPQPGGARHLRLLQRAPPPKRRCPAVPSLPAPSRRRWEAGAAWPAARGSSPSSPARARPPPHRDPGLAQRRHAAAPPHPGRRWPPREPAWSPRCWWRRAGRGCCWCCSRCCSPRSRSPSGSTRCRWISTRAAGSTGGWGRPGAARRASGDSRRPGSRWPRRCARAGSPSRSARGSSARFWTQALRCLTPGRRPLLCAAWCGRARHGGS